MARAVSQPRVRYVFRKCSNLTRNGIEIKFDSAKPKARGDNLLDELFREICERFEKSTLKWGLDAHGHLAADTPTGIDLIDASYLMAPYKNLDIIPGKAVSPKDTWERNEEIQVDYRRSLVVRRKYQYVGTVADRPHLHQFTAADVSLTFHDPGEPNDITVKLKSSNVKVVTSQHTFLFDQKLGRIVRQDGKFEFKGKLKYTLMEKERDWDFDFKVEYDFQEVE